MILPFVSYLQDGLGALIPGEAPFEWACGSNVTFRGFHKHSDGSVYNLAGPYAFTLSFKDHDTDATPRLARNATIINPATGQYEFYVTVNDQLIMPPGRFVADVRFFFPDQFGQASEPVVKPSRVNVWRPIGKLGDITSVPTFQQPLALGPGLPFPFPTYHAEPAISGGVTVWRQVERVDAVFTGAGPVAVTWPTFAARVYQIYASAPSSAQIDSPSFWVVQSSRTPTGCTVQCSDPFYVGTVPLTIREL